MAKGITPEKARQILHDGTVHGKPLTESQRKFFGARASGYPIKKEKGGEMTIKTYIVKIRHDNGVFKITTTASSEEAARKQVADAEGAPESAIVSVVEKKADGGEMTDERIEKMLNDYMYAALWSSDDDEENPLDSNYSIEDIAPETRKRMERDVRAFVEENLDAINKSGLDDGQVGHDIWLTRNHHGAGFWDRGLPKELGKELTESAHDMGEASLYVENGKIYQEGGKKFNKGGEAVKKKMLKKGDSVQIIGKRWFQSTNGNTYHSVDVYVNNEFVGREDYAYGYGSQYAQTGMEILRKHYSFPPKFEKEKYISNYELKEYGINILESVSDVSRKKDLERGGETESNFSNYYAQHGAIIFGGYFSGDKMAGGGKVYSQKKVPMTGRGKQIDGKVRALKAGWRKSKQTGKPYFENRVNRSDRNPKKKL